VLFVSFSEECKNKEVNMNKSTDLKYSKISEHAKICRHSWLIKQRGEISITAKSEGEMYYKMVNYGM
jgi:hypothetical protein